jgi:hypothetical protein
LPNLGNLITSADVEKRVDFCFDVDVDRVVVGVEDFDGVHTRLSTDVFHAPEHDQDFGATQLAVAISIEYFETN